LVRLKKEEVSVPPSPLPASDKEVSWPKLTAAAARRRRRPPEAALACPKAATLPLKALEAKDR